MISTLSDRVEQLEAELRGQKAKPVDPMARISSG